MVTTKEDVIKLNTIQNKDLKGFPSFEQVKRLTDVDIDDEVVATKMGQHYLDKVVNAKTTWQGCKTMILFFEK